VQTELDSGAVRMTGGVARVNSAGTELVLEQALLTVHV
jgi:hypothetical protein